MKNIVTCYIILLTCFVFQFSNSIFSQETGNYWGKIKFGPYPVGHKKLITTDPNRTYDYTLGDTTIELINKPLGRPILLNIYYPAKKKKGGSRLTVQDLWQFSGDEGMKYYLQKFESYEAEMAKMYAIDENLNIQDFLGDTTKYNSILENLFKNYASTVLFAKDGLDQLNHNLPVVIYHQGLGGTFDENILLLELLASHGFVVISSSFSSWHLGVGDTDASIQDIDFILENVVTKFTTNKQVFLTGHSFGANTIFNYPAVGKHKITAIAPLDSDYGYAYYYHMKKDNKPDLEKQTNYVDFPIFAAGRSEAHFRMIDLLDKSKRTYVKMNNFLHNDFCAQTIIGANLCLPFSKNQDRIQWINRGYAELINHLNTFILSMTQNSSKDVVFGQIDSTILKIDFSSSGKRLTINSFYEVGKRNCPSNSQLLSLIQNEGMNVAGSEWLNCKQVQDTAVFDFEWIYLFDALLDDSSTKQALDYLGWFTENRVGNFKLPGFAYFTYEKAFLDYGEGYHKYKANDIFDWMVKHLPNYMDGYKGVIRYKRYAEWDAPIEEKEKLKQELKAYCKDFLKKFPNYFDIPVENYWDESIQKIIRENSEFR